MAEEPDWAKVLETLYEGQHNSLEYPGEDGYSEDYGPVKKSGLDPEKFASGVSYLLDVDLLRDSGTRYYIEHEGFNVAHERELTKEQNRTNRVLAILTTALVFAALVQALVAAVTVERIGNQITVVIGTFFIGIVTLAIYRNF